MGVRDEREEEVLLFFLAIKKAKGISGKRARIWFYSLANQEVRFGFSLGRKGADQAIF